MSFAMTGKGAKTMIEAGAFALTINLGPSSHAMFNSSVLRSREI